MPPLLGFVPHCAVTEEQEHFQALAMCLMIGKTGTY